MSNGNLQNYSKPWLNVEQQVAVLESRGLTVADKQAAMSFLLHVNYYRFSGYCLAFEDQRHVLVDGTTFEEIKQTYDFDSKIRDLFTEALELIEIDLRTTTAYSFGETYGAFGHTLSRNFHDRFDYNANHCDWLSRLNEETERSSELFVRHFSRNYHDYPNIPIWVATEIMSFGGVSRMIAGMKKKDRKKISTEYQLAPRVLSKLTHHFAYVRNLCAHHCRLWDRRWKVKPELPDRAAFRSPHLISNSGLYSTVLLLEMMLSRCPAISTEASLWKDRIISILDHPPNCPDSILKMDVPVNWKQHPAWSQ